MSFWIFLDLDGGFELQKDSFRAKVVLACGALLFALLLGEFAARVVLPPPGAAPVQNWPAGLLVSHPERGYAYAPDFAGSMESGGRTLQVRTNSFGLRGASFDVREPRHRVLALGNSFTVGFGVEAEEAWPARLAGRLVHEPGGDAALQVINAGVSGYSLRQIRATAEELIPQLQPGSVIVGVYASRYWRIRNPYVYFHGYTVLQHTLPRLRVDDVGGLRVSSEKPRWRKAEQWLDDHSFAGSLLFRALPTALRGFESPPRASESDFGLLLAEIGELQQLSMRHRAELIVLLVSHQQPNGSFGAGQKRYNARVAAFCRERGIPILDPVPVFEREQVEGPPAFRLPEDHHWSPRGHDVVARELAGLIEGLGITAQVDRDF